MKEAAVHLGQEYQDNLRTKKHRLRKGQAIARYFTELILNQSEEIFGISTCDWNTIPWIRTTLRHDRAVKLSGHTKFRGTSALARGSLQRKLSIHHSGDSTTAELFRIIMSVNQLSVYGAVSDWCEELAQQISDHSSFSTVRPLPEMNDESESRISPNEVSI